MCGDPRVSLRVYLGPCTSQNRPQTPVQFPILSDKETTLDDGDRAPQPPVSFKRTLVMPPTLTTNCPSAMEDVV